MCYVEGESGLLAIWGTHGVHMRHIEALEEQAKSAGFPVTVECEWIQPDDYEARNFRHRDWVREKDHFTIR